MDIHIHVGADKTGSTAFQEFLVANQDQLERNGIHVIRTGLTRGGHHPLFLDPAPDIWPAATAELAAVAAAGKCRAAVLSWEGLHFRPRGYLEEIRAHFAGHDVQILYAMREQAELESSGILQRVKQLNFKADLLTIDDQLQGGAFAWPVRNPKNTLGKLTDVFGAGNVRAFTYDRARTLDELLAGIGVTDPGAYAAVTDSNPSLTYEAGLALQGLGHAYGDNRTRLRMRNAILDRIGELGGSRKVFLPRSVRWIRNRFRDSNAEVAREWFGRDELFPLRDVARNAPPDPNLVRAYMETGLAVAPAPET